MRHRTITDTAQRLLHEELLARIGALVEQAGQSAGAGAAQSPREWLARTGRLVTRVQGDWPAFAGGGEADATGFMGRDLRKDLTDLLVHVVSAPLPSGLAGGTAPSGPEPDTRIADISFERDGSQRRLTISLRPDASHDLAVLLARAAGDLVEAPGDDSEALARLGLRTAAMLAVVEMELGD